MWYRKIIAAFVGMLLALTGSLAVVSAANSKGVIGAEDGPWPNAFDWRPTVMTVYRPAEPMPENCEHKATIVSCELTAKWCVTPDGRYHKYWERATTGEDKWRLCKSS